MFAETNSVTDETVRSRYDELKLWLIVTTVFTVCSFLVLVNVDEPLNLIGFILLVHLLLSLPVFYSFHRCAVLEAVRKSHGQEGGGAPSSYSEPCGGVFGQGGASSSFLAYATAFAIATYRFGLLYTTCAFSKFKVALEGWALFHLFMAAVFMLLSVFLIELAKRSRTSSPFGL